MSQDALRHGDALEVSVDIQNTGRRDGEEVVQLYVNLPGDDTLMRLKGFRRVALKQGEMQTVKLTLSASDVSRWDVAGHAFKLPKGKMSINIGTSSADIRLKGSVRLQ
jgi:beta-glucosidase